jgi:predicted permease
MSMLDPLEFGGAFIITVAGILVVMLIAALFSLAERGGFSWLITDARDDAEDAPRHIEKREEEGA